MGVLLVAAQRRVRRHRPAVGKVAVRVRPADVVDPAQLFRDRFGTEIIRPHRVDEAQRPALLACAIIGQNQDQRVVANAGRVEKRDQPRQMLIGMVEHAGESRLQPREDALFVDGVLIPCLHAVIACGQPGFRRHDPHRLLPRHPLLALDVPAMGEHRVIALDDVHRRLVRRVAGAERHPGQPWDIGLVGGVIGYEADRLVDQVGREVIAVRIRPRCIDVGVVRDKLRCELISFGIEKTIEAIKTAPQRPAVERPGGAAFGQWGDVPFADHVIAIAVRPQHFRQRARLARDLAAISGVAAVEIGEAADTDRMMVAPGEQRRARRRTHRGGVKARIAQAFGREPVDGRRPDRRAVAAEIGKSDIVEQHDENVRRALRRFWRLRPPRLRFSHRLPDRAAERLCVACRHAFLRFLDVIAVDPPVRRGSWQHAAPRALPKIIIRIIIMVTWNGDASSGCSDRPNPTFPA